MGPILGAILLYGCYMLRKMFRRQFKGLFVELTPSDYDKLENLIASGKYSTKADAIRTLIRKEFGESDG
jgi:23S rRNA A2030 N6-methylase RlmJ